MAYTMGEVIQVLPPLEEPVCVLSVDIYRDGGSTEVFMRDANSQLLILFFDYRIGINPSGRLYLKTYEPACLYPVAQDSQAERDISRLLHQHLDQNYTALEQQQLASLDGSMGFRNISKHDHEGYLLLRGLEQLEELLKLAMLGVINRI